MGAALGSPAKHAGQISSLGLAHRPLRSLVSAVERVFFIIAVEGIDVTEGQHSAASQHLPWFITGPGETDTLYIITTLVVIATIVALGLLFFRLHSLPERMGHKKLQFEIVAVLCLLSLFTHNHAFWVAGLLLALIDLPDFTTPLKRMAGALETMSGTEAPADEEAEDKPSSLPTVQQSEQVKRLKEKGVRREVKTSRQRFIDSAMRTLEMRAGKAKVGASGQPTKKKGT